MEISLQDICFSYAGDNSQSGMIIKNFTGSFFSGFFYSVIGPNGSGKTTFLDLLSGFLIPLTGRIEIDSVPIRSYSKLELAKRIAVVSQDHAINFPFSVKEIVTMGRHPYIPRFSMPSEKDLGKVETTLEVCGIRHLQERRINELSGGERQRCLFARALCQDTPILLLDEAFSNMDIRHTLKMLQLVKDFVKENNKMVISVFHDLNLASVWSDAVLVLKDGEKRAFGPTEEVLTEKIIHDVFQVPCVVAYNDHVRAKQVYYGTH